MVGAGRIHDRLILDALEALDPEPFDNTVWRVTRKGRNPLRGSGANGRWGASSEFEVLYTSLVREGALAEIGYRLSLEPVWPSRIEHEIHAIRAHVERALRFPSPSAIEPLGVDVARYRSFEYTATQAVAAAANFLAFDALIVPSARFECANLVIFAERVATLELLNTQPVDWTEWRSRLRR